MNRKYWTHPLLVLAALAALSLTAMHPLMGDALPWSADGALHLYRLVALDHAMSDGTLWPRYVPSLIYGYGSPMFNYYSPLSLYPLQALHLLGLTFKQSWLAGMMLYTFTAAGGMYLLGRRWGGVAAGFVAAAAYLYAPYTLFDAVGRGTVSEYASLALLPWVWWMLKRLADSGRRIDFAGAVIAFALFVPMHNVIALHGAVITGVYALMLAWASPMRLKTLFKLGAALALGMGMTAFFWLPALTETRYVKLDAITDVLPDIDVTRNLSTLRETFAPPFTADATQMQPPMPIALGWGQVILSAIALVGVWLDSRWRALRLIVTGGVMLCAALIFMNLEASAPLWERLPLIRYSQFPWRLLGIASMLLALLAGIGAALIAGRMRRGWMRGGVITLVCAGLMLYGVPWLYTLTRPEVDPQNVSDALAFERESGFIGTSSFNEYSTIWTFVEPDADKLAPRYAESDIIARLDPPDGVTIREADWTHTRVSLALTVERETSLTFDWFFFIGWRALLNGQPLDLGYSEPEGLITVTVPAGLHTLEIWLDITDNQRIAYMLSVVSAFIALALLAVRPLWRRGAHDASRAAMPLEQGGVPLPVLIIGVGVVLFALKLAVIDRIDNPLRRERFAQGDAAGVQHIAAANFEGLITLTGYDLHTPQVQSGDTITLDLYWRLTDAPLDDDLETVVSMHDADGMQWASVVDWQPGGLSTSHWVRGAYLQQRVTFIAPRGTPPDTYLLRVGVLQRMADGQTRDVSILNEAGTAISVKVETPPLTVTRPDAPPRLLPDDAVVDLGAVRLVNPPMIHTSLAAGAALDVPLLWQVETVPVPDPTAQLIWVNGDDETASPEFDLVRGYAVDQWLAGDLWRGVHRVYVPAALDGEYRLLVEVDGQRHQIGTITVSAPPRIFEAPAMDTRIDAAWANGIMLLGLTRESENTLTLHWQTDALLHEELRVFVQTFDEVGGMIANSDGVPVAWTRPVTGWLPDEIVVDRHESLSLNRAARVIVGWYDPRTGERVPLEAGGDTLTLPLP